MNGLIIFSKTRVGSYKKYLVKSLGFFVKTIFTSLSPNLSPNRTVSLANRNDSVPNRTDSEPNPYSNVPYRTVLNRTEPYSTEPYSISLNRTVLVHRTQSHSTVPYSTEPYSISLNRTVLEPCLKGSVAEFF